ncbi:hypothetical protein [uncultured Veillonella sp.]|uniref:hypothetical protein n=1 Tax=uncultured Veillonella sp. TaxID=159268 RepID=UPI002612C28F|nr:hypothetical protein [uncultured Veillonella sp.]
MKKIDVVELYITKRIDVLQRENGEYQIHKKEINELKEVLDVIAKTRTVRCGKTLTKINGFDVDKLIKHTTSYL